MPLPMKSGTLPTTNPYEALGLTNNPFPSDPIIRPPLPRPSNQRGNFRGRLPEGGHLAIRQAAPSWCRLR
jgi:hypothetical protein